MTLVAGSRGVAEDAVQEAFVRLLPKWSRVSRYEDPSAWVRRVAYNILIDRQRARGRASRLLERISSREATQYHDDYPSLDGFDDALAQLSITHRQVLILYFVEDLSVDQIATELMVPSGTVKSRLSRARAAIEEFLVRNEKS
nr:sigma-70 family RNA polymerase sigma factor [Nocardioides daedukensis]